jgi:hypothetical protein
MTGPAEFVYVLSISFRILYILCIVNSHGPMLIGTMINIFLYGIMITQVYIYYTTYKR